ncbi:uncharacterized protein BDV14DRAFT_186237 [Aspergillus stella-maris]|uniref:uncharacterized protein n=1 Tax=Aspergillus stella-maris TaxID=1810926 RepID=UPI003CCD2F08
MADPVSVASGVIAISGFALQASKLLYQTIEQFRSSKRAARELRDEVEALQQTLKVLEHVVTEYEAELSVLKSPLFRCGIACNELSDLISRCVKHSDGQRSSLRDWTKLQYLGDDITNYKNVLANYKATINIALGGATFQSVAVTRQVLQDYKDMIQNTTSDLQERLIEIEKTLSPNCFPDEPNAAIDSEELQKIEEERQTATHCLEICKRVSGFIERYQSEPQSRRGEATGSPHTNSSSSISRQIAQNSLNASLENINAASSRLQKHLKQLEASLRNSRDPLVSDQATCELQKIREEKETIAQCLSICMDATSLSESTRVNIFEDVVSQDDAHQVLVSTIGDLLNAKRISTGMRSVQLLGQMSDDTVQHLSSRHIGSGENVAGSEQKEQDNFQYRHGLGRPLQKEMSGQRLGKSNSTP